MLYFGQFECQVNLTEFTWKFFYYTLLYYVITDLTALMLFIEMKVKVINISNRHIQNIDKWYDKQLANFQIPAELIYEHDS